MNINSDVRLLTVRRFTFKQPLSNFESVKSLRGMRLDVAKTEYSIIQR